MAILESTSGTFFIILSILVIWLAYYLLKVAKKPELTYQDNEHNQQLLDQCPTLKKRYWATPWLFNTHLQLILLGFKKAFASKLNYDRSDQLTTADGGTVSVEWLGLKSGTTTDETPTLVLLHTISGSAHSMRAFVRYINENLGWRVAVCIRRGHSELPLTSSQFNTMGSADDFRFQLDHIQKTVPNSPLFAVGISAGSSVLARYLGEQGKDTPLKAAVAYCPGYDLEIAFERAHNFYSKMMTKKLIKLFLADKQKEFGHLKTYQQCLNSVDLHDLHNNIYEIAGFESHQEYLNASNAAKVFDNIKIPTLILNAKDDPVCHIDNAYGKMEVIKQLEDVILVITDRGSHCAYFEGMTAKSWANKMIAEYLTATKSLDN